MADINNDGDIDLLVGDSYGFITVYLRGDNGELSSQDRLIVDDEEFEQGERTAPQTVDWDLDGDLDMLVGSSYATVLLLINNGNAENYSDSRGENLSAGGEEIWLASESAPAMANLDRDGKRDLIAGNIYGELWFYANTGEDNDPSFAEGGRLCDTDGEISLGNYSRPELLDWDGDGDLDLISGSINPELRLFINPIIDHAPSIDAVPLSCQLVDVYPNPFNSNVRIDFNLAGQIGAIIKVLNLKGNVIYEQPFSQLDQGVHSANISFEGLPS